MKKQQKKILDKELASKEGGNSKNHKHSKENLQEHDHEHEHGGIFGKNTELIFAGICGIALGAGFGLSFVNGIPEWASLSL
ncbi:MAG: hypothetical protein EOO45_30675, partial [Flavobacterium sp.]